jgi:hypothetical protein
MSSLASDLTQADMQRSHVLIPKGPFLEIMELMKKRGWLQPRVSHVIDLWNECDTLEQQGLLRKLLERFHYTTSADIETGCNDIAAMVIAEWKAIASNTKIIATAGGTDADGSQYLLQMLKVAFSPYDGWREENFKNTIGAGQAALRDGDTAILVDDFVGTGKTATRKLEWLKARMPKNCSLKFISFAAMEASKTLVATTGADFFSYIFLKRGISDVFLGAELSEAQMMMMSLEIKLGATWKGKSLASYNFGYARSEALYAQEGANVPNNVFPVFWWPVDKDDSPRGVLCRRLNP